MVFMRSQTKRTHTSQVAACAQAGRLFTVGCFYNAGECAQPTGWFAISMCQRDILHRRFETLDHSKARLMVSYVNGTISTVRSMACFTCHKPSEV